MAGVDSSDLLTSLDEISKATDRLASTTSKTRGSSELGKEEFLKLLVCQLSNQDPLNPQSDTEFISQLAQFSALEQMSNLNTAFANSSAYSLVGKEVVLQPSDSSEVRGTVDYVEIRSGKAYLSVGGYSYSMDDLVRVIDSFYAIQDYLPSIDEQILSYDHENPSKSNIRINLGSNGYEATSVVVAINGNYISSEYLKYSNGVLTISPEAFKDLPTGSYYLAFYFNDPYGTSIVDKVRVDVLNGDKVGQEKPDDDNVDGDEKVDGSGDVDGDENETEETP
ncbi:MAG: hypothetical protein J1F02_03155 [Lachnospiraceae bacterium]|nr:hypothetical protein [Lachnospiraceae bacterium]